MAKAVGKRSWGDHTAKGKRREDAHQPKQKGFLNKAYLIVLTLKSDKIMLLFLANRDNVKWPAYSGLKY
jgi:hypothetical protein